MSSRSASVFFWPAPIAPVGHDQKRCDDCQHPNSEERERTACVITGEEVDLGFRVGFEEGAEHGPEHGEHLGGIHDEQLVQPGHTQQKKARQSTLAVAVVVVDHSNTAKTSAEAGVRHLSG